MESDNIINIIKAINKMDINEKLENEENLPEKDISLNNNDEINNVNNSFDNNEIEVLSLESDNNPSDDEEHDDNNLNDSENEQYKIPNLFERLLQNKNNIKYKELIRDVIVKKNYKRAEMINDDDLKKIESEVKNPVCKKVNIKYLKK